MKFGRPYGMYIRPMRKRRISRWAVSLFIVTTIVWCFAVTLKNAYPVIEDVSQNVLRTNGMRMINESVLNSLGDDNIYDKIMNISYSQNGQITSVTANTSAVNRLKSSLTVDILNDIEKFGSEGFSIPLGNFTDIILLSGIGPHIPFRIIPYGAVEVDFRSVFNDAGINQTRHEIYIDVKADLHAVSVVSRIRGTVSTSVLAAQTLIVGEVPDFYSE